MNKLTKLLSIFLIAGIIGTGAAVGFTGCANEEDNTGNNTEQGGSGNEQSGDEQPGGGDEQPGGDNGNGGEQGGEEPEPEPEVHDHATDPWSSNKTKHWQVCSEDGSKINEGAHAYDDDGDAVCDDCGYERAVIYAYTNNVYVGGKLTLSSNAEGVTWSVTGGSEHVDLDSNGNLLGISEGDATVKALTKDKRTAELTVHVLPETLHALKNDCNFESSKLFTNGVKTLKDVTDGRFTLGTGVYTENQYAGMTIEGGNVNTQKVAKSVLFELKGRDSKNFVSFSVKGSAGNEVKLYKKGSASDTLVYTAKLTAGTGAFSCGYNFETNTPGAVTLEAGEYYIGSDVSLRIGNLSFTEWVPKSDPASLEVSAKSDFLVGDEFSPAGLSARIVNADGSTEAVKAADCKVDYSAVDMSHAGVYNAVVSYKIAGGTAPVKQTYPVSVYAVSDAKIELYATDGNKQKTFKDVYLPGQTFSDEGLYIMATGELEDAEGHTRTAKFLLNKNQYTLSNVDLSTVGEKVLTVSINGTEITREIDIKVIAAAQPEDGKVVIEVGATKNLKTITQALNYIKANNFDSEVVKEVHIDAGEYYEKIFVDIPNVHFVGADEKTVASGQIGTGEDKNHSVVLWFDAYAGKTEPSGKTYGTNGSASLTIAAGATGFRADFITVKNYYNTHALYKTTSGNTQACALLVESNKAEFFNCKFTSYHDTLYSNKGYHYYKDCFIEGRTDYIFGQDATVYFDGCTINTVSAEADDGSGGYVCALKPAEDNNTTYAFIYNGCKFITPAEGSTNIALGRAWGKGMKMVVINSEIDGNYSTAKHTNGKGNGDRYCWMSGNDPKAANMLEYNNTGAGAISASLDNTCTYMTAEQAAAYGNDKLKTLLGFEPGVVDLSKTYTMIEKITSNIAVSGTPVEIFDGAAEVTAGTVTPDSHSKCCKVGAGTVIKFKLTGEVGITWFSGGNYGSNENAKIVYKDGYATIEFRGDGTAGGGIYVESIRLDPTVTPEDSAIINTYQVSFNLGGAPGTAPATQTKDENQKADKPSSPLWSGHAFQGWFTQQTGGVKFDFSQGITENTVIYAQWTEVSETVYLEAGTEIKFGNGDDCNWMEYVDSTAITVSEPTLDAALKNNGGNNTQLFVDKTFSFKVKAGTVVTIGGYDGYTYYKLYINDEVQNGGADITAATKIISVSADSTITIKGSMSDAASGNRKCYFMTLSVVEAG